MLVSIHFRLSSDVYLDSHNFRCPKTLKLGFYAGYEYSKRSFQSHYGTTSIPVWATLASGGIGGIGYWTACYPLDVVKSRIQLADLPPKGANYIVDTFKTIYKEEGAKAFIRGLSPTCSHLFSSFDQYESDFDPFWYVFSCRCASVSLSQLSFLPDD